jgi:DNA-binding transcriptional MerR regulator
VTDGTEDLATLLRRGVDGGERLWTIGELARECDVTLRAMRFYEAKGLLRPSREGSTRLYDAENRRRLEIVLRAKRIGFSLAEIRDLLGLAFGREAIERRLEALRATLVRQTARLEEQRVEVETALSAIAAEIGALDRATGIA